jgi:HlyD family secretion protein
MNYDARIDTAGNAADERALAEGFNPLTEVDDEERRSRRRIWIGAAIAIVLLIGLWFALLGGPKDELGANSANQAPVVTVISPGRTTVAGKISVTGTLAARREEPVGVAGDGGQVSRVLVEAGQWVNAGQVLAVIDRAVQNEQAASAAAQIQVAQADGRLAQSNLDRALALVQRGFVSKADVDRLTANRDAANARVRVASAQWGELRARVRRLDIVAPSSGLVLERKIEPGQVVGAGSGVLFRLAKGGEMELLANLGETDLAAISSGVTVEVTPSGSAKSFTGQVWQVSPVIDPQTRQGVARVALNYAPELRPGGFASAVIVSGTLVAPLLPESAVLSDNTGSYVYIVGKDNKIERRAVTTGMITEKGIIIDKGLSGSERVVLRAGAFLSPGETIKPVIDPRPKG